MINNNQQPTTISIADELAKLAYDIHSNYEENEKQAQSENKNERHGGQIGQIADALVPAILLLPKLGRAG